MRRSALLFAFLCATQACTAASPAPLTSMTAQPRAFGWWIGDLVPLTVTVHAPEGLVLEESSVPRPGGRGNALELRDVQRRVSVEQAGLRYELTFLFQVFLSPPQTRTLETPGFTLRFSGAPRMQEIRVEGWPVTVSPLAPPEVSPRRGLGELRPDAAPLPIDTTWRRLRLVGYGGAALPLLAYLAYVYIGLPWRGRAHRPFSRAWRELRGLTPASSDAQWGRAFRVVHEALNRTWGEVLFESGIDRFVQQRPRFAHLRADLVTFFRKSRLEHFGAAAQREPDRSWLVEFCWNCRDAERGAA